MLCDPFPKSLQLKSPTNTGNAGELHIERPKILLHGFLCFFHARKSNVWTEITNVIETADMWPKDPAFNYLILWKNSIQWDITFNTSTKTMCESHNKGIGILNHFES